LDELLDGSADGGSYSCAVFSHVVVSWWLGVCWGCLSLVLVWGFWFVKGLRKGM
jgi:hypothetical protein